MKKLFLTIAIVFALLTSCIAQNGGGLFQRGENPESEKTQVIYNREGGFPGLPPHGEEGDQPAPVGTGTALLIGFGAAYAMYKKNKK